MKGSLNFWTPFGVAIPFVARYGIAYLLMRRRKRGISVSQLSDGILCIQRFSRSATVDYRFVSKLADVDHGPGPAAIAALVAHLIDS
jgi:hypothetical protein